MTGLGWADADQLATAIRRHEVSAAEVLENQLDRIQRHDTRLGSVVTLDAADERLLAIAEAIAPLTGGFRPPSGF